MFVNKPTGEIINENIVLWFKGRTFRKHGAPFELVKGIFRQEMHGKKFIITELIKVRLLSSSLLVFLPQSLFVVL